MSYADSKNVRHPARRVRTRRITRRSIAAYGTSNSANLIFLTGKQARRYMRACRADTMNRYGKDFYVGY